MHQYLQPLEFASSNWEAECAVHPYPPTSAGHLDLFSMTFVFNQLLPILSMAILDNY
jgi:hypothetical protein